MIPLADTTEYTVDPINYVPLGIIADLDLDGDGVVDKQALRSDGQIAVYLNGRSVDLDAAGQPINEDLLRQADTQAQRNKRALTPEQMHQGLLRQISEVDLQDTDILTYRESSGERVSERNKLQANALTGVGQGTSFGAGLNANGSLYYNTPIIWTERKIDNALEVSAFSSAAVKSRQVDNSLTQFNKIRDVIRPGEFIKTVIINRATGYIGSQRAKIESNARISGGTLGTIVPPIPWLLSPPNGMNRMAARCRMICRGIPRGWPKSRAVNPPRQR
ncbi:MAG TPA: hypothetical protein ENJ08_05050 [Gammaproteobacteria bacterium]|nr:hypothetical protein [Gammaproteobacteria bacterium]